MGRLPPQLFHDWRRFFDRPFFADTVFGFEVISPVGRAATIQIDPLWQLLLLMIMVTVVAGPTLLLLLYVVYLEAMLPYS